MERWSNHANRRSAQRSVPAEHVDLALSWGHEIRQPGGRTAYHFGRREARAARSAGVGVPDRAVGVAVVIAPDGTIVTVVRSPDRERLRAHGRPSSHRRAGASPR